MNHSHTNELIVAAGAESPFEASQATAPATRVGAIDLLVILAAATAAVGVSALLAGWPVLDRVLLLSAISAGATAPWLYSTMIGGSKRSILLRLMLFGAVLLVSFSAIPEIIAAAFATHAVAAVLAASRRRDHRERLLLLGWSGFASALTVACLVIAP